LHKIYEMSTTITLEYDDTNSAAKKILEILLATGFFKTSDSINLNKDSINTKNGTPKVQDIQQVDPSQMKEMMDAMDANLNSQDNPKVGIFWYSPKIKDVFGVIAVDAMAQAQIEHRETVSCKELHKHIWKKNFNYYKYHGGSDLFSGDYKFTPRGRIFYLPDLDEYDIMVGKWINDYPEAIEKIKNAFDLNREDLNVMVKTGIHWEIGMGYGD